MTSCANLVLTSTLRRVVHPHTLQKLRDTYGVDEGDLRVLASTLTDLSDDEDVSIEIGIELRKILSPDGERLHLFSYDETDPI